MERREDSDLGRTQPSRSVADTQISGTNAETVRREVSTDDVVPEPPFAEESLAVGILKGMLNSPLPPIAKRILEDAILKMGGHLG